jgi:hypothetical protein
MLLVSHFKNRPISKAYYWYLDRDNEPIEKKLPNKEEALEKVLTVARQVAEARESKKMECPHGEAGCMHCKPFEKIIKGEAEFVGIGGYNQELYIV